MAEVAYDVQRIQLRRTKGWRKPDGAVSVARPSKWGNPFTVAKAIETAGCPLESACHADVLLALANGESQTP